jgi:hypothetical protein
MYDWVQFFPDMFSLIFIKTSFCLNILERYANDIHESIPENRVLEIKSFLNLISRQRITWIELLALWVKFSKVPQNWV